MCEFESNIFHGILFKNLHVRFRINVNWKKSFTRKTYKPCCHHHKDPASNKLLKSSFIIKNNSSFLGAVRDRQIDEEIFCKPYVPLSIWKRSTITISSEPNMILLSKWKYFWKLSLSAEITLPYKGETSHFS